MFKKGDIIYKVAFDTYMDDYRPYYYKIMKKEGRGSIVETATGHKVFLPYLSLKEHKKLTKKDMETVEKHETPEVYKWLKKWKLKKVI